MSKHPRASNLNYSDRFSPLIHRLEHFPDRQTLTWSTPCISDALCSTQSQRRLAYGSFKTLTPVVLRVNLKQSQPQEVGKDLSDFFAPVAEATKTFNQEVELDITAIISEELASFDLLRGSVSIEQTIRNEISAHPDCLPCIKKASSNSLLNIEHGRFDGKNWIVSLYEFGQADAIEITLAKVNG